MDYITIRKIDNGFVAEWYVPVASVDTSESAATTQSGRNSAFAFATLDEAVEKVKEVLA